MIQKHNEIYELLKVMKKEKDTLKMYLYIQDLINIKIPYENDADMFVFLTIEAIPFFYNKEERYFYWPQLKQYLDELIFVYPLISFNLNKFDIRETYTVGYLSEFAHKLSLLKMSYNFRRNSIEMSTKLKHVMETLLVNYSWIKII